MATTLAATETTAGRIQIGDRIPVDPQTFGIGPADPTAPYAVTVDLPDLGPTVCAVLTVADMDRGDRAVRLILAQHDEPLVYGTDEPIAVVVTPDTAPAWTPHYEPWRHGGWYVTNVRYPSGAVGCVSRNFPDRKWRIVCGRPYDETFRSRDAAARAERDVAIAANRET